MTYVAKPPEPKMDEHQFRVVIRGPRIEDSETSLEKIIGDTVAARLGLEVTVRCQPPF